MVPVAPLHHLFDWFFEPVEEKSEDGRGMFYYMHISNPKYKPSIRIVKFWKDIWKEVWHRNFGKYGRLFIGGFDILFRKHFAQITLQTYNSLTYFRNWPDSFYPSSKPSESI
jgi:hypothetical protein